MADLQSDVLVALRRIMRATSLHSRKLGKSVGLTVPQLVVIRAIGKEGLASATEIARAVSLSQATVTTILNRLQDRQLLTRERSTQDRRRIKLQLTEAGEAVLLEAPMPLQDTFCARFDALPQSQQYQIVAALTHVAEMMDADTIDAAPLLFSADVV
ncbi:MAG: MarR family winged helix-turn-helix transcriptional regulator [Chromatocurvus sp.]